MSRQEWYVAWADARRYLCIWLIIALSMAAGAVWYPWLAPWIASW